MRRSNRNTKPTYIILSESEDEKEDCKEESNEDDAVYVDNDDDDEEEDEEEEEEEEDDEDASNSSASDGEEESDWSAEEDEADVESIEDESDNSGGSAPPLAHQSGYTRVLDRLTGRRDLEVLKLEECKAYLRNHGLRITGTKAVLVQRIQEHWRIKDGNGEKLYPRSSFSINCTGDVCKGDIVVFTQRVYEKFDKMKRRGAPLGKRTVAGRVVKESYGAAKQQHTFTVEVLWSKGYRKLPPLFPLLVKGRNLYRLRTFRQRWDNEEERSKVLAEKHKRGAAARNLRAMKKARSAVGGTKRRGNFHQERPAPKRRRNEQPRPTARSETRKGVGGARGCGKAKAKSISEVGDAKSPQLSKPTQPMGSGGFSNHSVIHTSPPNNHYSAQTQFHNQEGASVLNANRRAFSPLDYEVGSTSRHFMHPRVMPELQHCYNHSRYTHHHYNNPGYQFDSRQMHYNPRHWQLNSVPMGVETYRVFDNGFLKCSTPGCGDQRAENCDSFSCWRCCRRTGRRCLRHQP